MKQASDRQHSHTQFPPRRPVRSPAQGATPALGEILRTFSSAEEIGDALIRSAGSMEIAQTRLW